MSTNSKIEWTDHTFNPWWGCTKVHAGCTHCYAEATDKRWGGNHWGRGPRRMVLGEWGKPAIWNAKAEAAGVRARVFCASMCDLFEQHGRPVVNQQDQRMYLWDDGKVYPSKGPSGVPISISYLRRRVFEIIAATPWLTWLLLTKRPENIRDMVPPGWLQDFGWPANVWTGTSPCNQETADSSIPALLRVPGKHFLSCEPLIGPIDFRRAGWHDGNFDPEFVFGIDWVIVGGESGPGARPCDVDWVRSIVRQCKAAGLPCFVKQLGTAPCNLPMHVGDGSGRCGLNDRKGSDPAEWPVDLRVREWPSIAKQKQEVAR